MVWIKYYIYFQFVYHTHSFLSIYYPANLLHVSFVSIRLTLTTFPLHYVPRTYQFLSLTIHQKHSFFLLLFLLFFLFWLSLDIAILKKSYLFTKKNICNNGFYAMLFIFLIHIRKWMSEMIKEEFTLSLEFLEVFRGG